MLKQITARPVANLLAGSLFGLTACTGELMSEVVPPGSRTGPAQLSEYRLLRQDFLIETTWRLQSCAPEIKIGSTTNIRAEKRADPNTHYKIDIDKLATGLKEVALDVKYYDSAAYGGRVIKSVNAEVKDKTLELATTAIEIADVAAGFAGGFSFARVAPENTPAPLACNQTTLDHLAKLKGYKATAAARTLSLKIVAAKIEALKSTKPDQTRLEDIAALLREQDRLTKELIAARGGVAQVLRRLTITKSTTFKPDWTGGKFLDRFTHSAANEGFAKWFEIKNGDTASDPVKKVRNDLQIEARLHFDGLQPEQAKLPGKIVKGVVLRQPVDAHLFVCPGECDKVKDAFVGLIVQHETAQAGLTAETNPSARQAKASRLRYRGRFAIPQAGRAVVASLRNGPFQENALTFARDNQGRILEFGYKSNALATATAQAVKTIGSDVQGLKASIDGRKLARKSAELESLKVEADLLTTRKAIRDLRLELGE